jgi:Rad3-related DNA helicase
MTFPVENRPIKLKPCANVTATSLKVEFGGLLNGLQECLDLHPMDSILVHTVNYDLAQKLHQGLAANPTNRNRNLYTYHSAQERAAAIEQFKLRGGVMLAPSMDRGVDLPDDLCGVVVIAKMPYMSLGDRQVAARLHMDGGQTWYSVNTARSIVQMTGRGVRHREDRCTTYILDRQFSRWWRQGGKSLLPEWWREALV